MCQAAKKKKKKRNPTCRNSLPKPSGHGGKLEQVGLETMVEAEDAHVKPQSRGLLENSAVADEKGGVWQAATARSRSRAAWRYLPFRLSLCSRVPMKRRRWLPALPRRSALGSAEALAWSADGAGMCPSRRIFFSKYFPGGVSGSDWDRFAPEEGSLGIFQLPAVDARAEMQPTAAASQTR